MGRLFFISMLLIMSFASTAQETFKRDMYRGNQFYDEKDYEEALHYFNKIINEAPLNFKANFNKGNTLFRMEKFEESGEIFNSIADLAPSGYERSKVYYNLGNSHFMDKDLDAAIEAYKNGLRLNPGDEKMRYNLAYAQFLKKEQEKQNQQQNKNQNQEGQNKEQQNDQSENGDQKNQQQNGDQGDKKNQDQKNDSGDEQKDGNEGDEEKKEQGNNNDKNQNGDEKEKQKSGGERMKMSREQARRILEAAYKAEKGVKERLEKRKLIANGKSNKKDW